MTEIDMTKAVGPCITTMDDVVSVVGGPDESVESVFVIWQSVYNIVNGE